MKVVLAFATTSLAAAMLLVAPGAHAAYNLVQAWEGESFFDDWDFYGSYDNLTNVSPL
jgi:3',5'-cyclic AMP phosphodiesterase CpdA